MPSTVKSPEEVK